MIGPATAEQMIVAFLQAEIASSRFAANYFGPWETPQERMYIRQIITNPNLADPAENLIRKTKLALVRGYGWGNALFRGLSNDITWQRVRVTTNEIGQMLYANQVQTWSTLAPTLRVSEGAQRVVNIQPQQDYAYILAIANAIHNSAVPPAYAEIICLQRPDGRVSVMEGHGRATAFVMEAASFPQGVEVYLGSGASIANWFYL